MRLFVAVLPSEEAVEHLDAFLEVRRPAADFRWAGVESWHVTLSFMADADEWRIEELETRLATAAARVAAFEASLTGGGAFPDVSRAKVLWAGVAAPDGVLDRLAVGARNAAVAAGIEVDPSLAGHPGHRGTRFTPHLTLARLAQPAELTRWVRLMETYDGPSWTVDRIALVESHLGEGPRGRPRYEVVSELSLS